MLACIIEKSNEIISNDTCSELENLILGVPDLNPETKAFFFNQLEIHKAAKHCTAAAELESYDASIKKTMTVMSGKRNKRNQQVVTKTIQSVKSKQETKMSEADDFKFSNLSDCLENRNRRLRANAVLEEVETIKSKGGDDRSMLRTTWTEVINLYSLVSQNQILKTDDRDNYLPAKFLGAHYYMDTWYNSDAKEMYSFFINRMCAYMFFKASKKQQLNDKSIDNLLRCVTNFDSLVSVLHLRADYTDMFVDLILRRYWDLKKITNPDIVVKCVKSIMDETTEEYEIKRWFYNSRYVRKKSFDRDKVERIIAMEINHVRRDAIMALYNCAVRDKRILTAGRMKQINACLKKCDRKYDDSIFRDYIYKLVELAENLDDFNYQETFQSSVKQLNGGSTGNAEASLRFINNQAKDLERSQKLFTDDVIASLIELLGIHSDFSNRLKQDVVNIINTYLEHELTIGISEGNMELLLTYTFESHNDILINTALTSLLLSCDKTSSLPSSILRTLVANFDGVCSNEEYSSYVLFILSRAICAEGALVHCSLDTSSEVERVSHKLHCEHIVCLNEDDSTDGQRVRFERPSDENCRNFSNQISFLTAKIMLKSVENKTALSAVTVDNLILTLNSSNEDNKQTKIVAAKCLYGASKYMPFTDGDLGQMLDLINSAVYDVGVYIQAAYLSGCVKIAFAEDKCLDPVHLENISSLYVHESLKLGMQDYEGEINKNFFRTLLYAARKQSFNDENLFHLFENILNLNEKYSPNVLEILRVYTLKNVVPGTTVRTLENVLSVASHSEKALSVLQNLILSGRSLVTSKTLKLFIDNLYTSINSRLRFFSFKILEKVTQTQELVDEVFFKFELVKAGYALERYTKWEKVTEKQAIIDYIQRQTEKGMQLPIDTRMALEKEISHRGVLRIFANISKNKQIIPQTCLHALNDMFNPVNVENEADNILLISIFENAAKNNQPLPEDLLHRLEMASGMVELADKILPVFIYLAQKGEKLSKDVNDTLLDRLWLEENAVSKQELLSSIGSLIDANQGEIRVYSAKVNRVLIREIKSDNFKIQKLCIVAIDKLARTAKQLDDELLRELVQVGINTNCKGAIRSEICSLFDLIEDECNPLIRKNSYREKIKLANMNFLSNKDLVEQLKNFTNLEDGFLEQNCRQLQEIIDNADLQCEVLDILLKCKCKSRMTDELLDSVAILCESTMSVWLKTSCQKLFEEVAKSGKMLQSRAHEVWSEKVSRQENIKNFFQSQVCLELKEKFQLSDIVIEDVLGLIKRSERIHHVDNLANLIELTIEEDSSFFESKSFVSLIEQCLLKKTMLETILPCYCRIIKEKTYCKIEESLTVLAEHFNKHSKDSNMPDDILIPLVDAMYCASKCVNKLPDCCLKFVENNLNSSNEIVRGYSFRCLRNAETDMFRDWCGQLLENLHEIVDVKIEKTKDYLDILEITASVRFLDVAVFKENKRDVWIRELLVSSIFESLKVHQNDQMKFYTDWLRIEELFKYHESCKILSMIQMSKFGSFFQIFELISIIPEIEFDETVRMLNIYGPAPYGAFKQEWCMRQIQAHQSSKDSTSECYLNKLAEKFCSQFDVNFIRKLLRCIKTVDNLRAIEDLMNFCAKEKIKLDDMAIENVQLSDLRCSIEAKHLCSFDRCLPESEAEKKSLFEIIKTLLNEGWNFVQLSDLINSFHLRKFKNLIQILSTIQKYKLSPTSNLGQCKDILNKTNSFTETIRNFNTLAIENHFQLEGKIKDLSELLAELKKSNSKNSHVTCSVDTGSLNIKKKVFELESAKLRWNEKQIHLWAKEIRDRRKKFSDYEGIAVIMRANFLLTGHTLTDTQILCSLIALRREEGIKGKLLEVSTGEGKSTIICILAITNALRGEQVDVITSSPVLAERDAKQKAKLYRMFGLTCSDNNDNTVYLKGAKECYKADIVYGELSQFQFDMLRDNYSKLGTLGRRQCTTAGVDEVDSMLIDDSSKIARLSSMVAGMDHFQAIYVIIWQRLISITEKIMMFHNQLYFIDGKVGFENERITLEFADSDNNDILKIPDLKSYLQNTEDISRIGEVVGDDVDEYLKKSLEKYLDCQLNENRVYIPSNFTQYLEKQKSKWIVNAIVALNYHENVHYVVQDGHIKPVDYYSTGIVQSSTSWSDGLHQFLQLKHNLKMTNETLTTNFLSNIGFMHKYEQVFGLTGTLGLRNG